MAHEQDSDAKQLAEWLRERSRWLLDRSSQGARKLEALDRRIRRRFERTQAVLVLDMAGFTRVTLERGILHYLMMIRRMADVCTPVVRRHRGVVVKTEADNLFARFPSVEAAVEASLGIHEQLSEANLETDDDSDIQVSIGIGWGPILVMRHDMWGSEFNLASKLGEDIAGAGEVLLTAEAHQAVRGRRYHFRLRPVTVSGMAYRSWMLQLHARSARTRPARRKAAR